MVLAQRPVAREQIADRVILLLQRFRGRHVHQTAELILGDDGDERGVLRVQLLGARELLALLAVAGPTESLGADDQHRRPGRDVVGGLAAMLDDERTRIAAAEGAEFSGEDDELSCELRALPVGRQCVQSASAAVRGESKDKMRQNRPEVNRVIG